MYIIWGLGSIALLASQESHKLKKNRHFQYIQIFIYQDQSQRPKRHLEKTVHTV